MASITGTITDLDDLLYQFSNITASGGDITVTTSVAHNITYASGMQFAISGTTAFDGEYTMTAASGSSITLTSTGITATESSGQGMVNNVANDNTYFTQEITIDISADTFKLESAGNLSTEGTGVTGQALYSFFKERWKNVTSLTKYNFPMLSITNEQFEFINGWTPDATSDGNGVFTRKKIRTAGWAETNGTNVSRRYAGIISLGTLGLTDQPYYVQDSSFTATTVNTIFEGPVNEAVQIYGNVDHGDTAADDFIGDALVIGKSLSGSTQSTRTMTINGHTFSVGDVIKISGSTTTAINGYYTVESVTDANNIVTTESHAADGATDGSADQVGYDRTTNFKAFVRTRGKTYADADLNDIGVTTMTYIVYRFPVSNATDLNIKTTSDVAFTGATISSLVGDGETTTINCSEDHGLYVGAPVKVTNCASFTDGVYTVLSGSFDSNTITIASTFNGTETIDNGETIQLGYTDVMSVNYLPNPDTLSGDVVIRGNWTASTEYNPGDVVRDLGDSVGTTTGDHFYYANVATATISSDVANLNADSNIDWVAWTDGERDIEEDDSDLSAYTVVFELNDNVGSPGATKEAAYEYAQYLLRTDNTFVGPQTTGSINNNPNSTARQGNIADTLVFFVGSTLNTYSDTSIPFAVVCDDIASTDVNNIDYYDFEGDLHRAPIVVQVTIAFNSNLSTDEDAVFYAYYTTGTGNFGSSDAVQVTRSDGTTKVGSDVGNNVPNGGEYTFNYAYTSDTTNGRTPSSDTGITVVAIGLSTGQYVVTTGTITNAGASISLVAPLERNYTDPNG